MSPQQIPHCEFSMSHGVTVGSNQQRSWNSSPVPVWHQWVQLWWLSLKHLKQRQRSWCFWVVYVDDRITTNVLQTPRWSLTRQEVQLRANVEVISSRHWACERIFLAGCEKKNLRYMFCLYGILYDIHSKYFNMLKCTFVVTFVNSHMPHFSGFKLQFLRHWELPRFFVLRTRRLVLHFNSKLGLFPLPKRICTNFSRRLFGM